MGGCSNSKISGDIEDKHDAEIQSSTDNPIGGRPTSEQQEKMKAVVELFPSLDNTTIRKILSEHDWDTERAMEELLSMPEDEMETWRREPSTVSGVTIEVGMGEEDGDGQRRESGPPQQLGTSAGEGACKRASAEPSIPLKELRQLFAWCDSPDIGQRFQAAQALADLSAHTPNQTLMVRNDGVGALLLLLQCGHADVATLAAAALANLALSDENQQPMVDQDVVPPLVAALGGGGDRVQEQAARAVANICFRNEALEAVMVAAGVIPPLLLMTQSTVPEVQLESLAALANLARNKAVQTSLLLLQPPPARSLLPLLHSPLEQVACQASRLFANLSIDECNKKLLPEQGGLQPLVASLKMSRSDDVVRLSAMAIANLATLPTNHPALLSEGGLAALLLLLNSHKDTQLQAGRALLHLLKASDQRFKLRMVQEEGALPRVIPLTRDPDFEVRYLGAKILGHLNSIRGISQSY